MRKERREYGQDAYDWSLQRNPRIAEYEIIERFSRSGFWYPHINAPYNPDKPFKANKRTVELENPEDIFNILHSEGVRRLVWSGSVATPHELYSAIANVDRTPGLSHTLDNMIFGHIHTAGNPVHLEDPRSAFKDISWFVGENYRKPVNDQLFGTRQTNAYFKPIHLSEIDKYIRSCSEPVATAVMVTPPDREGFCSIINPDVTQSSLEKSILSGAPIFAFMNHRQPGEGLDQGGAPRTFGATGLHMSQIDYVLNIDRPLPVHSDREPDQVSVKIGENISDFIDGDENTQWGIGSIVDAIADTLVRQQEEGQKSFNLKLWTEVACNNVWKMDKAGLFTNDRHPFWGKSVTSFINGDKIIPYVDQNERFIFLPSWVTNRMDFIMMLEKMMGVVGALKVGTSGEIAADTDEKGRIISGTGGQLDFMYGSYLSRDGKAFVALPSTFTNKAGERFSNIVPSLKNPVTTVRSCQLRIASEQGLAQTLKGKSIQEIQHMMIEEVAHPDFRPWLREETGRTGKPYRQALAA